MKIPLDGALKLSKFRGRFLQANNNNNYKYKIRYSENVKMISNQVASTLEYFKSNGIILVDYWLESCIDWFKEQNPNYTTNDLHTAVYEQWLLLDFRAVEAPTLPPNLQQQVKFELTGSYHLQLMKTVDISQPKYRQLQQIKNSSSFINLQNENQSNVIADRMLQMTLTDGVQEVIAIELRPIPSLNLHQTPGLKIKITGPVYVRMGRIHLEDKHVRVLGGEVEEILESNSATNVLVEFFSSVTNIDTQAARRMIENVHRQQASNETNARNIQHNVNIIINNMGRNINVQEQNPTFDDTIADQEMLQLTESLENVSGAGPPARNTSPDIFDDTDFDNLNINQEINHPGIINRESNSPTITANPYSSPVNESNSDCDIFNDMDIDAHLDMIDKQISDKSKSPIKIQDLLQIPNKMNQNFILDCKFKQVLNKLSVTDERWTLKIGIEDDTGEISTLVHNDLITRITGYTPSQATSCKEGIANEDMAQVMKMLKAIENLKTVITNINGQLELIYDTDEDTPCIINIL